jgi:hypothetical protein
MQPPTNIHKTLAWLREHDPDVIAAVADVDRTLITLTLAQPPMERLRSAWGAAATLERLASCRRSTSTG